MLWYGFFFFFLFIWYIIIVFYLRLFYLNLIIKFYIYNLLSQLLLYLLIFFSFIFMFLIYYIFNFIINNEFFYYKSIFYYYDSWNNNFLLFNLIILNLNLIYVYYFPFIYIFILITLLSIFFCLIYNINELVSFIFYCLLILISGSILFFTDSFILFFFAYELLLIPSFFILYKFAKTRRCVEAAYLMFFWTQFGALFLIFNFLYLFFLTNSSSFLIINNFQFSKFEINFCFLCWIIGFGVKLPIWPFYNWLPKAHVEASTNFSIFLSGVLVKFAFFGLLKCLITVQLEPTFYYIYPFLVIGIIDSVFKLFYQIDLKKLIAYSTVIEMHWLVICIISGQSCLFLVNFCMLISHAILSTNSFLLVDAINRRFKTRLITEINGINFICPKLFIICLINCLIFLGFPSSLLFIAEFLFFSFFFDLFPLLACFFLLLLYLLGPTFFFRSWVNILFGFSYYMRLKFPIDLNIKEIIIYLNLINLMFWLGFSWQCFIC